MKNSTLYFKTENGNAYLYDFNKETYHNAPSFFDNSEQISKLCDIEDEAALKAHASRYDCTENELKVYLLKAKFLKKHGYFGKIEKEKRNLTTIDQNVVQNNFGKIRQLVFEVTEACNLRCYYCGYGKLYNPVLERHDTKLPFEKAKALIDYFAVYWRKDKSRNRAIIVSFYGGEPLLNFDFIEKVVEYMKQLDLFKVLQFAITTNGVLLMKHIDFLVQHDFKTDVSLDGDYEGNRYRTDIHQNNAHNVVVSNIEQIRNKYPDYFEKRIGFQAVLTNANSIESITRFFKQKFDKIVNIIELNTSDVIDKDSFMEIFKDYYDSLNEASTEIKKLYYQDSPEITRFSNVVFNLLKNTCFNIKDTPKYAMMEPQNKLITATCTPFWKKMFVTAKGNLMPCERINYNFVLGKVTDDYKVVINPDEIVKQYNGYYKSLALKCSYCYSSPFCVQCMFYVENLGGDSKCQDFMDERTVCEYFSNLFSFFEDNLKTVYSLINCTFYE